MLTKNGIEYDLPISPYTTTAGGIKFFFSSANHLDKFIEKAVEHRDKINISLYERFKMPMDMKRLSDLVLYRKIETRGFYIEYKGEGYTCLDNLTLSGVPRIDNSFPRSCGNLTQN